MSAAGEGGSAAAPDRVRPDREAFVPVGPHAYRLQAPLTFATVAALRPAGLALIAGAPEELTLHLEQVAAVDSAGLALLIDWLAQAQGRGRRLHYAAPSEGLLALARISDVQGLIQG